MRRLRELGWAVALVAVLLGTTATAWADYVDASESNDVLPQEYDYSLLEADGFSIVPGYEDQARQDADLEWTECLEQISYARSGAGWGGVGGWIYVSDQTGKCETFQVVTNGVEAPFEVGYEISHIDAAHVMGELRSGNKFLQHEGSALPYDEEQMAEAETELAGDVAAEAVERNGGGDAAQWAAGQAARTAVSNGASLDMVNAVASPSGALDRLVNQLKEDSGKAIAQGLGYLSQGLAFSGASTTFRELYAAAAGVGLVLLAAGSIWSFSRMHKLGLPLEETVERVLAGLVGGFFGLLFTPAGIYVCTDLSDTLTGGVVDWMGTTSSAVSSSLIDPFNALTTANSPLGYVGAVIVCILFFIAGFMLIVTFAAQYLAAFFGSVALGVTGGLMATDKGRQRHRMAAVAVVMTIFARPILMFMVAAALRLSGANVASADGWSTDPMGTFFRLVIALGAVLMVCFAPAGLVRFMPVGASHGGGLGRGFLAGVAGGTALGGGMAGAMFAGRMRSMAPRIRSAAGRVGQWLGGGGSGSRRPSDGAAVGAAAGGQRSGVGRAGDGGVGRAGGHGGPGARPGRETAAGQAPASGAMASGVSDTPTGASSGAPSDLGYASDAGRPGTGPAGPTTGASASTAPGAGTGERPAVSRGSGPGSRLSGSDLLRPGSSLRRGAAHAVGADRKSVV